MATVIHNPLKALGDQFYREAIEHCRRYNARLCAERSVRLPFLDSQTGVAQNNCHIWMERWHRGPGNASGEMYTYPARCWRKKRRPHPFMEAEMRLCEPPLEGERATVVGPARQDTTLETLLRGKSLEKTAHSSGSNPRVERSLLETQTLIEADEAGDDCHADEDFEPDIPKRKHRTRGRGRGSGRRKTEAISNGNQDKPYVCDNRNRQKYTPKASDSDGRVGGRGKRKLARAEELFDAISESDASTFHGFEDDELDGALSNDDAGSP